MRSKADPPVKEDCAQCGEPRKIPKSHPPGIDDSVYRTDPFCSAVCCRDWHGAPVAGIYSGDPNEKRGRHDRIRRQGLTRCE